MIMLRKAKFGQVVEKSFNFFLCLFGFMRAMKFRDSSKFSVCIQVNHSFESNFAQVSSFCFVFFLLLDECH